jgi:hypothetical protein
VYLKLAILVGGCCCGNWIYAHTPPFSLYHL